MRQFIGAAQRFIDVGARLFDLFQAAAGESVDVFVLVARHALEFDERGFLHQFFGDDDPHFWTAALDRETNQFVVVLDVADQRCDVVRVPGAANRRAAHFRMAQQRLGVAVARNRFGRGPHDLKVGVGEEYLEALAVENFR